MSLYERQYVSNSANGQKAWGDYGNFYKEFIHAIKSGSKDYAILAHEETTLNEQAMQLETRIPIKGEAKCKILVLADFTTILSTKQMPIKKLEGFENDLLRITDEEREDGFKYVFATRVVKESIEKMFRNWIVEAQ